MVAFRKEAKNLPMTVSTTNTDHSPAPLKVFLPSDQPAKPELGHPCEELAKSFEAATGWVLGFEESRYSPRDNRGKGTPRLGKIVISDLSADWPSRKPAASRRKCDEMVVAINELYNELIRTKLELQTAQEQLTVGSVDTIAELTEVMELTETIETVGVESSPQSQTTINDLPFAGWQAEVCNRPGSFAGWFVNADEQLVAVSIRSLSNDCSTTFVDAVAQASEVGGCGFSEFVETLELALGCDLETAGVELVFAVLDPLSGEINIRRAGEANESLPVSIFEASCQEKQVGEQAEKNPYEWVEYVEGDYFGFLSRGNSLALGGLVGGSAGSEELSQIVISRA